MAAVISTALPGYHILETLQDGDATVVYRAQRQCDQRPVIIKLLKADYPPVELITRLKQEYRIPQRLDHPGIVPALSLENHQNHFALVLEDFGGSSLKHQLQSGPLSLAMFLPMAIHLADILAVMHRQGVIHKDIKPSNIIVNPLTQQVKLTDFGIASQLSQEVAKLDPPDSLEGTLLYMSPEQTGRMNRAIDYRSDYYSLGVTFYEMLTGVLPFTGSDPLEVIHGHIAKLPPSPAQVNPDVPEAVASVVMKLLAKTAEERYQTAAGLKADLKRCLHQWQREGRIEPFVPGALDAASQLLLSQRLYGRQHEVATLMAAFDRVCQGTAEMVLVSGYSGIGKSSLVSEIHQPITRQRGYFIAGKFDQLNRSVPYSALIQAFGQLVEQVLAEPSDRLKALQEKLSVALAHQAQVLTEVVPEIEALIGPQPAVAELPAAKAQARFGQVLQAFIQVFAQPAQPLVLFVDNLQWADLASLQVLQRLMTSGEQGNLLVIGAYRDNEVSPAHPLMTVVEKIADVGLPMTQLALQPLRFEHVQDWIGDTLNQADRANEPLIALANLLFSKSQGNPFFLTQLLKTLHTQELIYFDFDQQRWQWDLERIQAVGITDQSVVDLVASNIRQMPEETQALLKLAACIGNRFSLTVLAVISRRSAGRTAKDLWAALQSGLVLPISKNYQMALIADESADEALDLQTHPVSYKFLHDRVQQAAYSLIPDDQKQVTHLNIGRLLQQVDTAAERSLDVVNQLNRGMALIADPTERLALARLNLAAGQRARKALAYAIAGECLQYGLTLVGDSGWQQDYALTLALHEAATVAAFLNTQFEQAQALSETALQHAQTVLDRVKIYDLQVQSYLAQNQMPEAISQARQVLDLLAVPLSSELPAGLNPKDLLTSPELSDPYKLAALRVLSSVVDAAAGTPEIFQQIVITLVRLCVEYGNSRYSAYAYGAYSWLLCGSLAQPALGYEFGQLSIALLTRYDPSDLDCKVGEIFNAFVCHWREPLRKTLQPLQDDVQNCLEVGNQDYACFAAMHYACTVFLAGEPLTKVAQQQQIYADMSAGMQRSLQLTYTQVWQQLTANLQGAEQPTHLIGDYFDESITLPQLIAENGSFSIFAVSVAKLLLAVLFRDYEAAIAHAQLAQQHEIKTGLPTTAVFNFYSSLAILGYCSCLVPSDRLPYLEQVSAQQLQLQQWAKLAPSNYQHKCALVAAEFARITGDYLVAMELYDQAIEGANRHDYLIDEALAYELASEFYQGLKRYEIARSYVINAYYRYVQWDAQAKVSELENRYPDLLLGLGAGEAAVDRTHARSLTHSAGLSTTRSSSSRRGYRDLDLKTILKSAQALSGEIVLAKLLPKLVTITIESMGAQRGEFLSSQEGHWQREASGCLTPEGVQTVAVPRLAGDEDLPLQVLHYVERIGRPLLLDNLSLDARFNRDPYVLEQQPKSVLCFPILRRQQRLGLLYLENNLATGAFPRDRLELLKILASQIAISIDNACLYQEAQGTIQQLQQAQLQIVQAEKMSALGNLVAGVAHEINNPVGFLAGNLKPAKDYVQDIFALLDLYRSEYPTPSDKIQAEIETVDLEFVQEDLPKLLDSMKLGVDRIRNISTSLRTFSRADTDQKVLFNVTEGLDSTVLILRHRLRANDERPEIEVVTDYGDVPAITCFPGQLNQVFMNLLANAIDALEEGNRNHSLADLKANPNRITIALTSADQQSVQIQIADNGLGMPADVRSRIFDHLFTTKAVGKGTGLGLAIARQIIVEKHHGTITVDSTPGQGTTFTLQLPIKELS